MAFDKNNMPLGMKVVVVIFAIILIISMCLPFFSSCSAPAPQPSEVQDTVEQAATESAVTVAAVDAAYQPQVATLLEKLGSDPSNLAALGNLGNICMDWGQALQQASDSGTDEAAQHITEVFTTAVSYYDSYLDQEPTSRSVRVDRACCEFYAGEQEKALADLEEFTEQDGTFSLAWFNLGVFRYQLGELEGALDAFNKAVEADAVESFNVAPTASIYAQLVQSQIDAQSEAAAEANEEGADAQPADESAEAEPAEDVQDQASEEGEPAAEEEPSEEEAPADESVEADQAKDDE